MTTIVTTQAPVIDLTVQEYITAPQQRRVRAPCKCGYCGETGHTLRMCKDPYIQNQYRRFNHQLKQNESIDSLVTWFMNHEEKPLKMLSSHFLKIPYHKCQLNQEEIIAKLRSYIGDFNHSMRLSKMIYLNKILESFHKQESREYLQERPMNVQRFISYYNQFEERATPDEVNGFTELLRICELQQPPNQHSYEQFHTPISRLERYSFISRLTWHRLNRFSKFVNYIAHQRSSFIYDQIIRRRRVYHELNPIESVTYTYCSFDANSSVKPFEESIECPICMDTADQCNISMIQCGHSFCTTCINAMIQKTVSVKRCKCPMCRTPIDTIMNIDVSSV